MSRLALFWFSLWLFLLYSSPCLAQGVDPKILREQGIELEQEFSILGVELPYQIASDEPVRARVYLRLPQVEHRDLSVFVHINPWKDKSCLQSVNIPFNKYELPWGKVVGFEVSLKPSERCLKGYYVNPIKPWEWEIFAGIYNPKTHRRLNVKNQWVVDHRVHIGWFEIFDSANANRHVILASEMPWHRFKLYVKPWNTWLLLLGLSLVVAFFIFSLIHTYRGITVEPQCPRPSKRIFKLTLFVILSTVLLLSVAMGLDFIKDDAYISFRYAYNFIHGQGLVFNAGERLEGFTNFLWIWVVMPFEAMKADLFQVIAILGPAMVLAMLFVVTYLSEWLKGDRAWNLSYLWASLWLASSSSVALWTTSGMEQPLAMLLPILGTYLLWKGKDLDEGQQRRWTLWAGIVMGLGCITRPEIHLIAILVSLTLLPDFWAQGFKSKRVILWSLGLLLVLVPIHSFRWIYYGDLLPNTFYVKTGHSWAIWFKGLEVLERMWEFNHFGWLWIGVPWAFLSSRKRLEKLVLLLVSLSFMLYIVKVGRDEMRWYRLYLPALPYLVLLAAHGYELLATALMESFKYLTSRKAIHKVITLGIWSIFWVFWGSMIYNHLKYTYDNTHGFDGWGELSGEYHPDLGKYLTRHSCPGTWVAFQDMGSTPYAAPDLKFFDFIGLVEAHVARLRYQYGLNAFNVTEHQYRLSDFNKEMQNYFFKKAPAWSVMVTYVVQPKDREMQKAYVHDLDPTEALLKYGDNGHQYHLERTQRFKDRYVHIRTWKRSRSYYLSLFERRDLWEQKPKEVVIQSLPSEMDGHEVVFENGLKLLGWKYDAQTLERHEIFLTTWWSLPGPGPKDLMFFVHMTKPHYQYPFDHIPGDWLYPADRWVKGEYMEDRVLLQMPLHAKAGTYDLYFGVFEKGSGKRLKIIRGSKDPYSRVPLGKLKIEPLHLWVDELIPRTDVQAQRGGREIRCVP